MTIRVTYQAENYNEIPRSRLRRYVRASTSGLFFFCEIDENNNHFDVRQGECTENDLPVSVATAAIELVGQWPAYVEWSINN